MLNLLQSYFDNRSQSTVINNVMSKREIVNVWIPQSSCLGSLLFLVYINDFFSTEINMRLFANNTCLSYQHSDLACVNSVITEELRKVDVWLRVNRLFLIILKLNSFF